MIIWKDCSLACNKDANVLKAIPWFDIKVRQYYQELIMCRDFLSGKYTLLTLGIIDACNNVEVIAVQYHLYQSFMCQ